MEYINSSIRRQDRLLEKENAFLLLKSGEYGILSMLTENNEAYGIPVNFVWNGETSIYLHCAPEGKKLCCIQHCPTVSFCVVGKTNILPHKFTTNYESIVLSCEAHTGLSYKEKMQALSLLLDKYSPTDKIVGMKYVEKSFHRTEIIRLDIKEWSGKCKRIH